MSKITYLDKVALNINPDVADVNKCNATDMNEIKQVVNENDDNVGDLTQLTTDDKSSLVNAINEINNISLAKMHTNFGSKTFSSENLVTGWEDEISIGDIEVETTNNRIKITNTEVLEVTGATAGTGNCVINYSLLESGIDIFKGAEGRVLFQGANVGNGYWSLPLKMIMLQLDKTKTYYLQIYANGYNSSNFDMNSGFGTYATYLQAKKIK